MNDNNAILSILVAGALLVLLFTCFVGCKSLPPAVVPQVHSEHNGHDRDHSSARSDSIHIRDSIVYRWKHDTLMVNRWHTEYRDRWRHDTLTVRDTVQVTDSIPFPVYVEKPVPRQLNGWQRFIYGSGYSFWALLILGLVSWIAARVLAKRL